MGTKTSVISEILQFRRNVVKGGMLLVDYVDIKKELKTKIKVERDIRIKRLRQMYLDKKILSEDFEDMKLLIEEVANKYIKILVAC